MPLPWVAQLFGDHDNRVSAAVRITLKPLEELVKNLEREIKKLSEESELLRKDFDKECAIAMLCNKSIVAYMQEVMS